MEKGIINTDEQVAESLDALFGSGVEDLQEHIKEDSEQKANFVIAFDATGSMQGHWAFAQVALIKALDEIRSRTTTPFRVKMIAYRDECDGPRIIEQSDLTDDLQALRRFIEGVLCMGGGDYPEAVYQALREAIKFPYSRMILLGDAPSQPDTPGYTEATELGKAQCPVFTLRLTGEEELKQNFEEISRLSGGKSFRLKGDPTEAVDVIATIVAKDRRLLKGCAGLLPYHPKTEKAKEVASQI